ncbi:hypothetical protein [Hydrogenophaga sp.]|jgi:hypothetical protein|uniref:hypothetical protein n=1 Tax=Hydrogenophaga sp. TaxID=1904254 RepID=UPI003F7022DC
MALFSRGGARARTHHPPKGASSSQLRVLTLATQAAEQASLLMVMLDTFVALEKLIQHDRADDAQALAAKRDGLCSLMRSLNGEMARQVDGLVVTTGVLLQCVVEGEGMR